MLLVGCSHGKHLAQKIAKRLRCTYSNLNIKKFPDNEIGMRFMSNVRGKAVVLVQSFYGNVNECIVEALFAAETARDLGAKKVFLIAPYFPYTRKDKRYEPGECISGKVLSKIISRYFDKVYIVDPHLHRKTRLPDLFSIKSKKLTSNPCIVDYIKTNIKNPLIVGPDKGSLEMVKTVAHGLRCKYAVIEKKRISGRKVKVRLNKKLKLDNKNIVFVDDIISTGNTILECTKILRKLGMKKFYCIAVHGIFVENALERLRKANIKVVTTNTIPNKVDKIDISQLISEGLIN
jgi:ribose-phosphate pyrophosphokinase|tara:strand:- start:1488 stop:2360 length:873 start_codon:yes stop_codon:yes gene_type:complete